MSYWPLLGIALVVLGFALKLNPMLVVTGAAIVTGLLGGMDLVEVISTFGKAFNDNRIIAIVWIVLPVIGLLERYGLQQRAAAVIRGFRNATTGKLLLLYLIYRQITAAIGLHSTAGHPQTVRPLVAPMALAAAEKQHGELEEETAEKVKAYSAATDNVGLFFGEDIFFAIGSIVLIQATLSTYGYELTPLQLALWAIPSAIAAFFIHGRGCSGSTASWGGGNDHAPLALHARGRDVRGLRPAQRARSAESEAVRQCGVLGPDGAEPARRRLHRRLRQRPAGAWSRGARRFRLHRPQPSADDQRAGARGLVGEARQQAVPAGADHPGDRARSERSSTITRRPAASAGSRRSARPTFSSASACCSRSAPSSPGCDRPRSLRCRKAAG